MYDSRCLDLAKRRSNLSTSERRALYVRAIEQDCGMEFDSIVRDKLGETCDAIRADGVAKAEKIKHLLDAICRPSETKTPTVFDALKLGRELLEQDD